MTKLTLTLLLGLQAAAPADEYAGKLAQLRKNAAGKHFSIGDYLATAQQHLWAREQFQKAMDLDPDHAGARRKLGFKKADAGWEFDPAIKQEYANKKKGEDEERVRKGLNERLDAAGRDLAKQWSDLGHWCKKAGLAPQAEAAYKKALEYDPALAGVRKELGFEKDAKGGWLSRFERELRKEMKEGIPKAPRGEATDQPTETEKALSLKNRKRVSPHFLMESPHLTDEQLDGLLQHAEHAYALYHKIFDLKEGFRGGRLNHVILQNKAQHEKYVDAFETRGAAHKALAKKSHGSIGFPRSEHYQEAPSEPQLQDWVVHTTVQVLSYISVGGENHWIHEGTSYYFTRLMKDSAATYCVDLAGSSAGSAGKNYQDPNNWPIVCKVWIREGKDPDINAILKCDSLAEFDGAETVKAWSLVDFLLVEHREKFLEARRLTRDEKTPEEAFKTAFGWTLADLDQRWKTYVKAFY